MVRKLTDEEIDKISDKEWKNPNTVVIRVNKENAEGIVTRTFNLTGPKTKEGKKKCLQNLIMGKKPKNMPTNLRHGGYVKRILDQDEEQFYLQRREDYLKDYDINGSADEVLLNLVLMDEVIIFRMLQRQQMKPSLNIHRPMTDAQNRLNKNLENLGMLRRQRLNQDKNDKVITIATLAEMVSRDKRQVEEQIAQARKEEEEYLDKINKRKAEQETSIIDADYTEVTEDSENKES